MARTPASANLTVVRGSTWEDEFTYTDENGDPIDLTGYEARMQIRTTEGMYGDSTTDTLVMELSSAGTGAQLTWDTAETGRLLIRVEAEDTAVLNPDNLKKHPLVYGLELYLDDGTNPEYVIPLVVGKLTVQGEVVR